MAERTMGTAMTAKQILIADPPEPAHEEHPDLLPERPGEKRSGFPSRDRRVHPEAVPRGRGPASDPAHAVSGQHHGIPCRRLRDQREPGADLSSRPVADPLDDQEKRKI